MKKVSFFEQLTTPTGLVVSLSELKSWLKIDGTDEDAELTLVLNASQDKIACYLGQELLPFSARGNYDQLEVSKFERYSFIAFKKFPIRDLTRVAFWNGSTFTDLTVTTDYLLEERDSGFPRVLFKCPANFFTLGVADDIAYPVSIEADVGYVDSDAVPDLIKVAILQYAALLYDNRGDCSNCECDSNGVPTLPMITRAAISKYKIREVFG